MARRLLWAQEAIGSIPITLTNEPTIKSYHRIDIHRFESCQLLQVVVVKLV